MAEKLETEDDYRVALARFLELCNIQKDSAFVGEFFRLIELLENYEKENCS